MSLVVFTALTGLVVAPVDLHPIVAITAILAIAVGAGASGALNMAYEADIDALMSRTQRQARCRRDVCRVTRRPRSGWCFPLYLCSPCGWRPERLPPDCSPSRSSFMSVVYTMVLKPRTTSEHRYWWTWPGALPPAVAWSSATGGLSPRTSFAGAAHLSLDAGALLGVGAVSI